ncbi:thiamine diphosphokinase [Agathobacter sp.]|uniref:thiamine diphosphokinase n=1 Tax=Agathobacter sp. TaxID=2021311 RepID=UPI003AB3D61D
MKYLIVCGGEIDGDFAERLIMSSGFEVIIAADRGMDFLYEHKITPDIIVGDFDSVKNEALSYFKEKGMSDIHVLNPEKDDTDSECALQIALDHGADHIIIIGATGTRIDHVLGNISLLGKAMSEGKMAELLDTHNRIRMIDNELEIEKNKQYGKYVSIIPVCKNNKITLEGFKYPLKDYTFEGFNTLGISNEIVDDIAKITVNEGQYIVIESKD